MENKKKGWKRGREKAGEENERKGNERESPIEILKKERKRRSS